MCNVLRAQENAFKSGDQQAYKDVHQSLQKGIKTAKHKYKQRTEKHFDRNNTRNKWQGIKKRTSYKQLVKKTGNPGIDHLISVAPV